MFSIKRHVVPYWERLAPDTHIGTIVWIIAVPGIKKGEREGARVKNRVNERMEWKDQTNTGWPADRPLLEG